MKNHRRISIVDRSILAHNVYKILLKPLDLSIFYYKTLRDLKENFSPKMGASVFLINSNTFGNHFDRHLHWFQEEPSLQGIHKVFLCENSEKKAQSFLKSLSKSHLVLKPFFPASLEETLKNLLKGASS